jgi:hypothetical protein
MDRVNYLMDLLYIGTNIFVRNKKKMMYEKIESRKGSTELSVYEKKQAGEKNGQHQKNP